MATAAAELPTGTARLMITLAVMSATLIQVLDTTIVNVALPHMAGELGETTDQVSWVLTSYLVSSAIVMPLTGYSSWRWTFYINVPVGALSFFLATTYVPDTRRRLRRMDWTGLVLLGSGIAGLQYLLDRGTSQDWFAANDIRFSALVAAVGIVGFGGGGPSRRHAELFGLRNFQGRTIP